MKPLPDGFTDQMREMLGSEAPAFFHSMEEAPALALRLNPWRFDAENVALPYTEGRVPWEALGRYLRAGVHPGSAIAHRAGAYYLQEASAMMAANALKARPGERVLDLCAAPGGKSTQIAAAMGNTGLLVSNDPELSRAKVLAGNLERMGVANAIVTSCLPEQLAERWPDAFDAVLVDAPCSGEGMFRRDPDTRDQWNPAVPPGCARRQAGILDCAARMLRPGGRLVYSTCTFNRFENEDTIEAFLARRPDFSPEDFSLEGIGASCRGMLRAFPHRLRGDGHFSALLKRSGTPRPGQPADPPAVSPPAAELLRRLQRDVCALPDFMARMTPVIYGDRLICLPEGAPAAGNLRIVSPGLAILRAGRSHIEPEHALAMALPTGCALRTASLDDDGAAAFLAGQAVPAGGEKGWTLAVWRAMPLGWGKCTDGVLKNHLPKGLRKPLSTNIS